jgi:hypothetical protein
LVEAAEESRRSHSGASLDHQPVHALDEPSGGLQRVLKRTVYLGPRLFSRTPIIRVHLDLGLEDWPTNKLPSCSEGLIAFVPGFQNPGYSCGATGGLEERLHGGAFDRIAVISGTGKPVPTI